MKDPILKAANAQYKKSAKILIRAGLYNPKVLSGQPTDYFKRLSRRYSDVIEGRAETVKVPNRAVAQSFARAPVEKGGPAIRAKGARVVIAKKPGAGRARYNKKKNAIRRTQKTSGGSYVFSISPTGTRTELPPLKRGQSYAVPVGRGNEYIFFSDAVSFWNTFGAEGSGASYKNALQHVEIVDYRDDDEEAEGFGGVDR